MGDARSHAEARPAATVVPVPAGSSFAISRHTVGNAGRFAVEARQLNACCRVPGNPFSEGLLLSPNDRHVVSPVVTFWPIEAAQIDAVSCMFLSRPQSDRSIPLTVRVGVLDEKSDLVAQSELTLANGQRGSLTLRLGASREGAVRLRVEVLSDPSDTSDSGSERGAIEMYYLAAYRDNELMRLFNAVGSDKGSETYWSDGFPHFYGLTYDALFSSLRGERFNLLEIGLDAASHWNGQPVDAPSLRVWREFFPMAILYGYDIHDFSFFAQRDTHVFQGNQSSRADISHFLETTGMPRFRVIVDDGSHASSHQQISLAALFEHVEPSGTYIIEDLDWQPFEESPKTREVLQRFIDTGRIESPFISSAEARRLEETIASVDLYRPNEFELAVITKQPPEVPRPGALRRVQHFMGRSRARRH
jgi:hypothetical protein